GVAPVSRSSTPISHSKTGARLLARSQMMGALTAAYSCPRQPDASNNALFSEPGDVVPAAAQLQQDFFGMLAQLRRGGADTPGRRVEIDWRRHDFDRLALRRRQPRQSARRAQLRILQQVVAVIDRSPPDVLALEDGYPLRQRTRRESPVQDGHQLGDILAACL